VNNAHFAQPQFLWALLLAGPALLAFFYWSWRVKQKLLRQFIGSRLLGGLLVGVSPQREKLRLGLIVAAVVCAFLALARPQWGFVWEEAHQQGLDIMVAVDTSRSMLAQDVAPNRLERAKLAALDLMHLAKSDRLGLIAFAGSAFLQAPLTLDEEAFRQSVEALQVGIIPQGGTALSAAIRTALEAFEKGNDNHKVLVLMTDGEDHDIDTETAAAVKEAEEAGLMIFTIGVGTPEGELLRVKDDQGNMAFVKDEKGDVVKSRLNKTLLQQIATTAKGFYLPLQGADPMKTLYDRGLAPLPKSSSATKLTRVYDERYHWPLGLAALLLALEIILPESTSGRRRKKANAPALSVTAALLLLAALPSAHASPSGAYRDYQNGKYDASLDEYLRLAAQKTNDYRLHYNAGAAAYKAKDFEKAVQQFNTALESPDIISDPQTQEHAHYDLGNTLYQMGEPLPDPDQKKQHWEKAVENYGQALQLNTNDIDAKNNLAYLKQKLEELKQQQQQQKKNDKNKDDKDKKDQKQDQKNQDQKDQKDQQNKQDKSGEQKDKDKQDQQQQQQAKNDKQKEDEKKKEQQQQQAQKNQDKKDKDQQAQANKSDERKPGQENPEEAAAQMAQMTPQQARQILDAQRDDEKALIFQPTNMPAPPANVSRKDW
jgi:Ca-activated chloride channel family protein